MRAIALSMLLSLAGCAGAGFGTGITSASDDKLIRQIEEQERNAVLGRDVESLQRLWSEEFTVNNPMNRVSPDRAAVLELVRSGRIQYAAFDRRIEQLRVLGDLAIVMGAETVQPKAAASPVQRRFTHVWRKQAGHWRLVARHANDILVK